MVVNSGHRIKVRPPVQITPPAPPSLSSPPVAGPSRQPRQKRPPPQEPPQRTTHISHPPTEFWKVKPPTKPEPVVKEEVSAPELSSESEDGHPDWSTSPADSLNLGYESASLALADELEFRPFNCLTSLLVLRYVHGDQVCGGLG